jgi:hypothetical protein
MRLASGGVVGLGVFALGCFIVQGCGSASLTRMPGSAGQACFPNGTCDTGLVCLSQTCVSLNGADAGAGAAGAAGAGGVTGAAGRGETSGSAGTGNATGGAGRGGQSGSSGGSGTTGTGGDGGIGGAAGNGGTTGSGGAAAGHGSAGASGTTGSGGSTSAGGSCSSYKTSTIAAMRSGGTNGCFQLVAVVSIGLAPSATSPRLFVQDAAGGDYSAMVMTCPSTSTTHPCTVAASVSSIADGRSVTATGSYSKSNTTNLEEFLLDSISDNGTGTMPGPATATAAEIERSSTAYNLAFQQVTTTLSASNALIMYDWTPSEFVYNAATVCPYQGGFGMIAKSVGGVTPTAACTNVASQPAGQAAPNGAEVLIGTDFYKGFTVSSDCRCAKMAEPGASSTLIGTVEGILVYEVGFGATTGFFYLAPKTNASVSISGTMPGP